MGWNWQIVDARGELSEQARGYGHGMDAVDDAIDFEQALEQLTGREALAIGLRAHGRTNEEIADVFHMTPQGVSYVILGAIKQIKKRMA